MRPATLAALAAALLLTVPVASAVAAGGRPDPPAITAAGAVLWEPADDAVLYGMEEERPRPMASTTKIMTALLAVEAASGDDEVTVSAHAAGVGGATLGLDAGQRLPLGDVLVGLLLHSGNDAAVAVAEHVAGSEEAFVEEMNARAAGLGLDRTRFVNASGLTDDPDHAASPMDLARLAHVVMEDRDLAALAGAEAVEVDGLGRVENRNELIGDYPGATGLKTGFTALAGQCLIASATRDGRTLYAVVLDSEDSFADAAALLDHGFDDFRRVTPVADGAVATRYRWSGAVVDLLADGALAATVPVGAEPVWRTDLEPLPRPVEAGAVGGEAVLVVDGRVTERVALRAAEAVPADPPATPAARAGAALQDAVRGLARTEPIDRPVLEGTE